MGRRRKCRFVAGLPVATVFKPQGVPLGRLNGLVLGVDGYEALRLVDAEGLTQEAAAMAMGVSRPTLCRILGEARTQVARALTRGWVIRIETDLPEIANPDIITVPCSGPELDRVMEHQGGLSCQDVDRVEEAAAAREWAVDKDVDREWAAGAEVGGPEPGQ
ncbi:MAG: DUF134 domain-containing protein [Deltaproteobacteria bacterium]|nr:DUF134 domain-containing protein [Deltaproteobacteria bacterium]